MKLAGYMRLGDVLISVGMINEEQLQRALKLQKGSGKRLGTVLVEHNIVTEQQLIEALQLQLGVEFIDLTSVEISPEMAQVLSKNISKKYQVVPVKVKRDELYLAMTDPLNFPAIEEVKAATKKKVIPMIATAAATERAIVNLYGNENAAKAIEEMRKELANDESAGSGAIVTSTLLGDEDPNAAPTIRLVNSIIERAIVEGASDIHFESREKEMVIRLRVDGVLHDALTVPQNIQGSVISRIKIMGGMDIAERRQPQDGRANIRLRQMDIDLRIATLPTIFGEKVTIRVLNKSAGILTTKGIGLMGHNMEVFSNLIHNNASGVILVVGPTGSGKSSSLYTIIGELNNEEVNIMSLEDPVEYNMDGINQVQINEKAGMTFASGLRSFLRHDPDIISVGEIRDKETADIAMRSAITGHLVLSTVHTNNAVSTIDRLFDLGVEPFLVASALRGIISQRLVRRICKSCRMAYPATAEEAKAIGLSPQEAEGLQFYKGDGCADCNHTGYRGRTGVFEILTITSELADIIHMHGDDKQVMAAVARSGFQPIIINCRDLVLQGITTISEVKRAIQSTTV